MTAAHTGTLSARLAEQISAHGPLRLDAFWRAALFDPGEGYYRTAQPLGTSGDFVTAPEISQLFGEMIGLCLIEFRQRAGLDGPFNLVELGPGRGTLMADIWRTASLDPAFRAAAGVHLVEVNPVLQAEQARRLAGIAPIWHRDLTHLPEGPILLIANEFLDALPIRQARRTAQGWLERHVGFDTATGFQPVDLPLAEEDAPLMPSAAPPGHVHEWSHEREAAMAAISRLIDREGGLALLIDYGEDRALGADTLQALRAGRPADPFQDPGVQDLTSHVDFAACGTVARAAGAVVHGPIHQGGFLKALGIELRAETLARQHPDRRSDLIAGLHRLTAGTEMGRLFRVLALTGGSCADLAPAGFER